MKDVPGVLVGQTLLICRSAFDAHAVQALGTFEDGVQRVHALPQVLFNEWGQRLDAPVVGESYKRHAETPVQTNLKAMERRAMDAATDEEAAQKRKAGAPFMGGRFDAFADIARIEQTLATPIPRRGQVHGLGELQSPSVAEPVLPHIVAAKRLRGQFPEWGGGHYRHMQSLYPDGVPESALDAAAAAIAAAMQPVHFPAATVTAPRLRAVG